VIFTTFPAGLRTSWWKYPFGLLLDEKSTISSPTNSLNSLSSAALFFDVLKVLGEILPQFSQFHDGAPVSG